MAQKAPKSPLKTIGSKSKAGLLAFVLGFAVIGLYLVFKSFAATTAPAPIVKVAGDKLVDATGSTIQLRGVNRAGMEYQCVADGQNGFISSGNFSSNGPSQQLAYADTVASALLKWDDPTKSGHAINAVRIPINEECYLGINVNAQQAPYSGAAYQAFLKRLVDNLTNQGMYVILDDHWSSYGTKPATSQGQAPNADHSITFFSQLATQFKDYHNIMFDLFNEPNINCYANSSCPTATINDYFKVDDWTWNLYLNGGPYINTSSDWISADRVGDHWTVAGTQQLTDAIRTAGSMAPIIVEALGGGSGYVDGMGSHMPKDPVAKAALGSEQIVASTHSYDFGGIKTGSSDKDADYDYTLANGRIAGGGSDIGPQWAINGHYPFFLGEFGEIMDTPNNGDGSYPCPVGGSTHEPSTSSTLGNFTEDTMKWLDKHGYSSTAWGWDQQEGCHGPSLVMRGNDQLAGGNDMGVTTVYGARVKLHLQSQQASTTTTTTTPPPADTTAPTVSISSPPTSAALTGKAVSISANASDNVSIARVEIAIDGTLIKSLTTSPYSLSWDSTTVSNGTHTIKATAYDTSNISASTSEVISVSNTTPAVDTSAPTVSITSPSASATVSGAVNAAATASDNVGVVSTTFTVDGTAPQVDSVAPYSASIDTTKLPNGNHVIIAEAVDAAGNKAQDSLSVMVSNGAVNTLTQPTALSAVASVYNSVNLSWKAGAGNVTNYLIIRNGSSLGWTGSANTTFVDSTVNANTSYSYVVAAYDSYGNSSPNSSSASVTTPSIPDGAGPTWPNQTSLSATAVSASQINLSWAAASDNIGVTSYDVYRGSTKLASVTTTSFGDTGLASSTKQTYYVVARDAASNSSVASNLASATTLAPPSQTSVGILQGVITDSVSKLGIAGARLKLYYAGAWHSFVSNSQGYYQAANVPAANGYTAYYSAKSYNGQNLILDILSNQTIVRDVALIIKSSSKGRP